MGIFTQVLSLNVGDCKLNPSARPCIAVLEGTPSDYGNYYNQLLQTSIPMCVFVSILVPWPKPNHFCCIQPHHRWDSGYEPKCLVWQLCALCAHCPSQPPTWQPHCWKPPLPPPSALKNLTPRGPDGMRERTSWRTLKSQVITNAITIIQQVNSSSRCFKS